MRATIEAELQQAGRRFEILGCSARGDLETATRSAAALARDAGGGVVAAGADLILGGHIHLPYLLPLTETPHPTRVVQAGTAVSNRVRRVASNSMNVIRYDAAARRCRVERWDCSGGTAVAEFVARNHTELQLRAC